MTSQQVVAEIHDVSKSFTGTKVLDSVSASIRSGVLTGLVGPDGAGKTTLMRMIAGLLNPETGSIEVVGKNSVEYHDELAELIGYMPQRFGLYEDLSVMENMQLYAQLRGIHADEQQALFAELLKFTRLEPFTKRLAGKLSGGMKQKLGLACALMARPRLLLLDEPGVGVDPLSRQDLWAMVDQLLDDGMAVVWATAYLDEAEQCDEVLLLNQGSLLYSGKPDTLTQRLNHRSFKLNKVYDKRREVLRDLLEQPFSSDGVIQGKAIRAVLSDVDQQSALDRFAHEQQAQVEECPPRFEDAFIDLLGGAPAGRSELAEKMDTISNDLEHVVECSELTKQFGQFKATDNVSFSVKRGEVFGLLGPNGAGKSTTFKMLCGLLSVTSGSATVAGVSLATASTQAKMQLGYMAQKFSLYSLLSVKQNLEFSAGVYGLKGKVKKQRIQDMIETFHLQPYLNTNPDELSLGYKQRLALACAVMHQPKVLFLDEPTSGVDPITRREFWTHINGFVAKGMTVMVTTHFMDEAEYCDRIALMYRSRLIALDSPDNLKSRWRTTDNPDPTMEQAFIKLIENEDE
ncbi:ATP-binding cassette domain-containing protein [Vibrio sp. SCSIO 43137]|uniref:ATP-binding cassette domain-containing protein n=1 Tax=Vibrio sp. SCSIO 43137 TaxID=3021011 RepID=UPI002307A0FC|nr:ATP-binding cassette domain-containing protein [Vibrio sp. SCSIO 43137]WCE31905.1 ATP-binding cassette domain-containing protein [Vibrio sp. SCSIO 43137]